ncbi:MAG: fumarylacetoacetase [Pseudomonadota bacterium]
MPIDATHDPALKSWVPGANDAGCDFPIQNLPYARLRPRRGDEPWRIGVAIGAQVLDLAAAAGQVPWPDDVEPLLQPLAVGDLAGFMALGRPAWKAMRAALSAALAEGSEQAPFLEPCLLPRSAVEYALPCRIGDYTDFYAGIHHARTVGSLLRPDAPLLPNYRWVPIGYHGRASSVVLDGSGIRRPCGQSRAGDAAEPTFGPSRRLDHELELGLWIGAANELGRPVPIEHAEDALFGVTPLNDWSARDIQTWEYQPLGPFLSKSFATSVSPWIVTMEALEPFRRPFVRAADEPQPLPYLDSESNRARGSIDIRLEVRLQTPRMRAAGIAPVRISHSSALDMYWTPAQLVAHHTSNGCNLQRGDLLGTGTLSGPGRDQGGCLLELTRGGREPLALPGGETRTFLEDDDLVVLSAWCEGPGAARIALGSVEGRVLPAHAGR